LREVQRGKSELAGLESQLKYQQQQFDDKTKKFREAVSGVFEKYFGS